MNFGFAFRKDFPIFTLFGLVITLAAMFFSRPYIALFLDEQLNFSLTNENNEIIFEFTDQSIWILISLTYLIFITVAFLIPLSLYFRGLTKWEWDPTNVIFWLILTRGFSVFLQDVSATNPDYRWVEIFYIMIDIIDSVSIIFLTVFLLKSYTFFIVPAISNWLTVGKSDTQYGPILEILGSILIIVFGVTNFLSTYHVDFGVLLAGVGVVGLVIALAAQDTLSNFFSGILLLLDQGFKTGDMIKFGDTYCLIREVGLRSTKIYDIINHVIIIIPNNSLANQDIVNLTKPDRYYRLRILVGVSYDSNPREVEETLIEVAKDNKDVEHDDPTRRPLVRFQAFGDSTLNFALVVWIKNVIKVRQINSDLHHEVFEKLRERGIVIAFPQRDVHLYDASTRASISSKPDGSNKAKLAESEKARLEAEQAAREAEEEVKQAEASARKAKEEKARLEAEEAAKDAEVAAKEAEEAAKKAEEEKSKEAENMAKKAEEAAKKAEEEKAKKEEEEQARIRAEWEAKESAKKEAEEQAFKREAEEQARIKAEKEAKEAEEAARLEEEERAKKEAEEAAKIAKEKKAKLEAEEAETRKLIEEIKARQASQNK